MKLKNKLLPLVGAGAILATVAPISLTSCGATSNNGFVDLTKKYKPDIEYYTGVDSFANRFEALEIYAKEIVKNPNIFVQDYLWSSSTMINDQRENYDPDDYVESIYQGYPIKHDIKIVDASAKAIINPTTGQGLYHMPLISLSIEYSYAYQFDNDPNNATDSLKNLVKAEETGTMEIIDMPFIGYYSPFSFGQDSMWLWNFSPTPIKEFDISWSVKMEDHYVGTYSGYDPVKGAYTYTKEEDISASTKSTDEEISRIVMNSLMTDFWFASYYFWLVGNEE